MFKVNNKDIDVEHISHLVLVFLLLNWTCKCRLGYAHTRFSENLAYVLNEWPSISWTKPIGKEKKRLSRKVKFNR